MACACQGNKNGRKPVEYKVRFKDGNTQTFNTTVEAQRAIRTAGGGTMRAVPAAA